ncbi:hypothetical protein BOO86_21735 [Mycobacterium sp. CBMA 234]|nr:hypothetical protein [Mycolicibacterium sp. CBMA 234]
MLPGGRDNPRPRQIAIGVTVYVVAALVAASVGYIYLKPPGERDVAFALTDAASVKPGTQVRVAGVPVGTVSALKVGKDAVRVELRVKDDVYLGNETSVDIRLLTALGGYFVNLTSAGSAPLGDAVIPVSRTHPPYSLTDLLADSTEKLKQLDSTQIGANLDQLATALESNSGAVTTVVNAVNSVSQIVNHQQDQFSVLLDTANELLHTSITNSSLLATLAQQAAVLSVQLDTYKYGIQRAGAALARIVDAIVAGTTFYDLHRDWVLDSLQRTNNALNVINTDIPRIVGNLGNFVDAVRGVTSPGDKRNAPDLPMLATDMCVPLPGRTC